MTPADLGLLILVWVLWIAILDIQFHRKQEKRWREMAHQWETIADDWIAIIKEGGLLKEGAGVAWGWQRPDGSLKTEDKGRVLLYNEKPRDRKGRHGSRLVLLPIRGGDECT